MTAMVLLPVLLGWLLPATVVATQEQVLADLDAVLEVVNQPMERDTFVGYVLRSQPPGDGPLARFTRDGNGFMLMFYIEQSGVDFRALKRQGAQASVFRQNLITALKRDSAFTQQFLPVIASYLAANGIQLSGVTPLQPVVVDGREMTELAARFFYVEAGPDGRLVGTVCSTMKGVRDMQRSYPMAVEALVFAAVKEAVEEPQSTLTTEFRNALREVQTFGPSKTAEWSSLRAQGWVWSALVRSSELRRALDNAAAARSSWLPIRVQQG